MAQIEISPASQLAEAERIRNHTKRQHEKIKADGGTITAAQALTLIKREAIVATLRQVVINAAALN